MDRSVRMTLMAIVVRLGPVALLQRRAGRIEELERVIGEPEELIDVASGVELVRAVSESDPVAVVLDAAAPGDLVPSPLPKRPGKVACVPCDRGGGPARP